MTVKVAAMSLKCMPLLFLNMGGEMAYILQQRLQAQNVGHNKSTKVLSDILYMMFNKKFLDELFKPQEVYSRRTMRSLFEKLAHSSIMRLNETSMDKLYDLMTMAFKYQLQLCTGPNQLLLISMNHLDNIRKILPDDENMQDMVDTAHNMDARVKVSLLLRENKQMDDGRFFLFPDDHIELLFRGNPPGTIRYYEEGEYSRTETFPLGNKRFEYTACTSKVKGGGSVAKSAAPPPGDELKLLSALIAMPEEKAKKGFNLSLFNDDTEEKQFLEESQRVLSNTKRIDASKQKKSLTKAVAEASLSILPSSSRHSTDAP
ncbi:unnamed protein product [Toxocara canis]|uniref:Protein OSCP1 n=1 Tax=Toxocara canis TaxID=6265 RepID=A0A183TXH1_TOXCA|nr:unnamed protein product [Toxocara canis]